MHCSGFNMAVGTVNTTSGSRSDVKSNVIFGLSRAAVGALALLVVLTQGACGNRTEETGAVHTGDAVRVACVGNSITFGAGIRNRAANSYPAQLAALLGDGWEVRNFGVSGATMLKRGSLPYWRTREFAQALDYRPHVVVIKLGTNDTRPDNRAHAGEFAADYEDMIARFRDVGASIFLCTPAPAFQGRAGITESLIREEIAPAVRGLAATHNLPLIDMHQALAGRSDLFPDSIHPNAEGAREMAELVFRELVQPASPNVRQALREPARNGREPAETPPE